MKYSKFINSELDKLFFIKKSLKRGATACGGCKTIEEVLMRSMITATDSSDIIANSSKALMYLRILSGDVKNIFIESDILFKFLSESEVKDVSAIKDSIETIGSNFTDDKTEDVSKYFNIKTHNEAKFLNLLVSIPNKKRSIFIGSQKAFGSYDMILSDGDILLANKITSKIEPTAISEISASQDNEYSNDILIRFSVNLFLYMACFPECVTDAPPSMMCDYKKSNKKAVFISAHESIIDRSGVSPHFRRGYFRLLSSSFFKNKQGKVVFVKSTFVKGSAITVLDDGIPNA
jgi:hypothetical protein